MLTPETKLTFDNLPEAVALLLKEVSGIKAALQAKPDPSESERLLSPKETCTMLSVDNSTLYRWDKLGYLVKMKIGGKVRYRMSDIQKLLEHDRK
jgi:predicted DNA-binding transcriptional regulator AlpA